MPEIIKNATANEFLNQAEAIRTELADTSKTFTKDEVEKRVADIAALKQRALAVAEVKEKELEKRVEEGSLGGTKAIAGPETRQDDVVDLPDYQEICERVVKAFGGAGRYILARAREGSKYHKPWTAAQQRAVKALEEFQSRVIVGTASDGSGGEFLLPLTQAPDIFIGANIVQPGLFERAPRYPCPGRTVRIPYLIQDAAADTRPLSGIAATAIEAEAGEKDEREPSIGQRTVTAYKWAAYTEAGDEVLEDDYTGQLPTVLQRAVGGDILNSINLSVTIGGSGSAQPLGALHASNGALITVNRTTSQSIVAADVFAMLSKSTMGPRSFWIAHPSTIPQLYALALTAGSQVTFLANMREGGGQMLMGVPIVFSHLVSVLGVAGDLGLIDPDQYAAVARRELTMESSIHYKFRNDVTAYRFFARAGGLPIPTSTYSFASGGVTKTFEFSGFVRLGDDATS